MNYWNDFWDGFWDLIWIPILVFGSISICVASIIAIFYIATTHECNSIKRLTGNEIDVSFGLGCMVKYEGQWVSSNVVTLYKSEVTIKDKRSK